MSSRARRIRSALGALAAFGLVACSDGGEKAPAKSDDGASVWTLDNTQSIGGHTPTVLGAPASTDGALCFDGVDDALIFSTNPLEGLATFTVEVRFLPTAAGPPEQRFIHLQEDATVNRVLIETRVSSDGTWHLDTYLHSGSSGLTLIDPMNAHPTESWHWAALSYENGIQRHFVDAREELSGAVDFAPLGPGQTSIGVRLNQVDWFQGCASELRIHDRALPAEELAHD